MEGKQVSKSQFKAKALEFFRRVEASGESVVVTDHGTPALEVRTYQSIDRNPLDVLRGSVTRYDDPTAPVDVKWEAHKKAKITIERELNGGRIIIAAISAWEIAMLVERDKLVLSMDVGSWLAAVAEIEAVCFMPVDIEIAVKSVELPGEFHKDSADRMIVATARKLAAPLVTKDEKIRAYAH
ncbi:hypothetical protein DFQ30_005343, partial [Apophysomyces sp. BC1015]